MKIIQKSFKPGDTVRAHSVFGGYPLPEGLSENESVIVMSGIDHGRVIVKIERGQFNVSLCCIDSGWHHIPW